MKATVEQRVAAGVTWLDEHVPDWYERIDLGKLDISQPCGCVVGQIYGSYGDRPDEMYDEEGRGFQAYAFIRNGLSVAAKSEFGALTAEWRRVIVARRAEAVLS